MELKVTYSDAFDALSSWIESIQWNWKGGWEYGKEDLYVWESIQWNWKEKRAANIVDDTVDALESIQWNWKSPEKQGVEV